MTLRLLLLALAFTTASAQETTPPVPAPPPAPRKPPVAQGADLFVSAGCIFCHGTNGVGGEKGPSLQNIRKRMTVAQMTHQIHDGGQSMPPFGDTLTPQDISDLIAWLRAKKH